jgi:hypothetical protein
MVSDEEYLQLIETSEKFKNWFNLCKKIEKENQSEKFYFQNDFVSGVITRSTFCHQKT